MTFKEINIGQMIEKAVTESGIAMSRLCNFFKSTEEEEGEDDSNSQVGAGTGNPGNPGRLGAGPKPPKEVGAFGKQIAQAVASHKPNDEQPNFFR